MSGTQSTDAENARAPLKVSDRSAPVKKSSRSLRQVSADLDTPTSALQANARVQKFGGSTK